jgi:hypothetical protein
MRAIRSAALPLLVVAALLGNGPVARADVTVATVANPTPVSFFAGRLIWSAFAPARNGYVLMTHAAGTTSPVPVQPRSVPFDVDLGPDEQGDTVAVYSRCGREPAGVGIPKWRTGRGCDIFKFSFATGRETRVASANGARSSEFLPSIWDTRIAFARVYERRRGRAGDRAHLYARSVLGAGRATRLPPGARGTATFCVPSAGAKAVCRIGVEDGPTALDLRGRRVAFSWDTSVQRCDRASEIWLDTVGGGRRPVDDTCWTNLQGRKLVAPTISGGRVHYVRSLLAGELGSGGSFLEYRIGSGRRRQVFSLRGRVVMSAATDAGNTFYLLSGGFASGCSPAPGDPGTGGPCLLNELAP